MSIPAFAYVNAEKSLLYRAIMTVFVGAKQRFLVHLRPEDIVDQITSTNDQPVSLEEVQTALDQLVIWGNLLAHPDTGRVTSVEDFYRARYLYQLSREGEAAEIALVAYDEALGRRAALQSVALEDIRLQLRALRQLALEINPDPAQAHALLRDLSRVFTDLAENAQAFMTGLGRTLDLRSADREIFLAYKERLIGYLERFISDLVTVSDEIARLILEFNVLTLDPEQYGPKQHGMSGLALDRLLTFAAERESADAAPIPELGAAELEAPESSANISELDRAALVQQYLQTWQTRWQGLHGWFVGSREHPSQAALLRNRARRAITELLEAVTRLNERRLGRSDRSADFRTLALWFAEAESDLDAHRLWRAAFGLTPARHLSIDEDTLQQREQQPVGNNTSWLEAPPLQVSPRLRATGNYRKLGLPPAVDNRDQARALLAQQLAAEGEQVRAARARLATGEFTCLSELGELDQNSFALFLQLLGEALSAAREPGQAVSVITGDGSLRIEMEPLAEDSYAEIHAASGIFCGRDHRLCITDLDNVNTTAAVAA